MMMKSSLKLVSLILFFLSSQVVNGFNGRANGKNILLPTTTSQINPPKKVPVALDLQNKPRGGSTKLNAWPLKKDPKGVSNDFPNTSIRVLITVFATCFTWYAQKQYSNVVASAAVTLICSMCFDKRFGQAAMCGTFAGMGSMALLVPNWNYAILLGVLTSAAFEFLIHTKNAFLGVGGRLGATSFIATSIIASMQGISTGLSVPSIATKTLEQSAIGPMAFWHAVGSVATIVLREASDDSAAADPVRASAVVGLLGALLLENKAAALGVYGGSFIGMSLPSRLMYGIIPGKKNKAGETVPMPGSPTVFKLLASFAIAGAFGGIVHGLTVDLGWWPGAWGGKAGFCAFLGCLVFRLVAKTKASLLGSSA